MIIIVHVLCPAVHRGGRRGDQNPPISYPYNKPFSATLPYPMHNTFTHLLHHSHLLPPHLFPTAMPPYPPCTVFHIPPAPTIQLTSAGNTHRSLSNFPHKFPTVSNKCSSINCLFSSLGTQIDHRCQHLIQRTRGSYNYINLIQLLILCYSLNRSPSQWGTCMITP